MADSASIRTRIGERELTVTNLQKVLYPLVGYTKAEVISYYSRIAPALLPHIADRALTRVRFPDGVGGEAFYEKNRPLGTPEWVRSVRIGTSDGVVNYIVADEPATVVWLANLAALELHTPQWTVSSAVADDTGVIDLPGETPRPGEPVANRVVVDLDPGAGMSIVETARAALIVAARMAADGLLPVPQTSGSKGIQVYAAIAPARCRDAWAYAKALNGWCRRQHPQLFVSAMSVAQRAGRIYLDYNQDLAARNTVAPYSMRGREVPTVATPVTWEEVGAVSGPGDLRFSPEEVLRRVEDYGDLAADLLVAEPPELPLVAR